ncbi:MAG: hypothetical protein NZ562_06880, partial [Thermomicrobium sp.]|nr:hypothetical protein [Thermomicrobium sp.]
ERGHAGAPSDNFTAWAAVYAGSVLCEYCRPLLRDRRFRSRSWLATPGHVRFVEPGEDRSWLRDALLDPPDPPFALYLTRNGQKHGWLSLQRYVSQSRDRFWVGTDWSDRPVYCDRLWLRQQVVLLDRLAERGVSRGQLLEGRFAPNVWKRAIAEAWTSDLEAAQRLAGDPQWEVLVYAAYRSRDRGRVRGTPGGDLPPDQLEESAREESA